MQGHTHTHTCRWRTGTKGVSQGEILNFWLICVCNPGILLHMGHITIRAAMTCFTWDLLSYLVVKRMPMSANHRNLSTGKKWAFSCLGLPRNSKHQWEEHRSCAQTERDPWCILLFTQHLPLCWIPSKQIEFHTITGLPNLSEPSVDQWVALVQVAMWIQLMCALHMLVQGPKPLVKTCLPFVVRPWRTGYLPKFWIHTLVSFTKFLSENSLWELMFPS